MEEKCPKKFHDQLLNKEDKTKLKRNDDEGKLEVKFSADFPISCCCPQKKLEIHATDWQTELKVIRQNERQNVTTFNVMEFLCKLFFCSFKNCH